MSSLRRACAAAAALAVLMEGIAVPQLYVGLPSPGPGVVQPPRQLRGYAKLRLRPGETRRVSLALDARALSYWDTGADGWRLAPGCYRVMVGSSSRDLPLQATTCFSASAGGTALPGH